MRMKRFAHLIALLMLALSPLTAAAQKQLPPYDRIIPPDAVLFVEQDASLDAARSFTHFDEAMAQLGDSMDDFLEWRVLKNEWNAAMGEAGARENWQGVGAGHWCFAITGFGERFNRIPTLVYIAELKDPERAGALMKNLFESIRSLAPVFEIEDDNYDGLELHSLFGPGRIPGLGLAYSIYENHLFVTTSKPFLITLLDRIEYAELTLADSPPYREVIDRLPERRSYTFYFPISGVADAGVAMIDSIASATGVIDEKASEGLKTARTVLEALGAVRANGWASIRQDDGVTRMTGFTRLIPDRLNETAAKILQREPANFPWESYLPRTTGSFTYFNVLHPKDCWEMVRSVLEDVPHGDEWVNGALDQLKQFNVDLENDVFSWMGDSFCLVRPVLDLNSVAPVNRIALIIEIADEKKLNDALKKLEQTIQSTLEQFKIPVTLNTELYRGAQITSFGALIPLIPISPCLGVHDGKLLISSDLNLLKEMLDVNAGARPGISTNREYQSMQPYLKEKANKLSFQDVAAEFYANRESMMRMASLSGLDPTKSEEEQRVVKAIVDRVGYYLGCLQIYRAAAKRTEFGEDGVVSEKWTLARDLRATPSISNIERHEVSLGFESLIAEWARDCAARGDDERAVRLYRELIKHQPGNADYLGALASLLAKSGNLNAADEVFDTALQANPVTSMLVLREMARGGDSPEQIASEIEAFASNHANALPDASLFGVAVGKRNRGEADAARVLFEALNSKYPSSPLAPAARVEAALTQGEQPEGVQIVPYIPAAPSIDGSIGKEEWAGADRLIAGDDAGVFVAQAGDSIYLAFALPHSASPAKSLKTKIDVSPWRDYARYMRFSAEAKRDGETWNQSKQDYKIVQDDPYDLAVDETKPQINLMDVLQQGVFDGLPKEVKDFLPKPNQPVPASEWRIAFSNDGVEAMLPVSAIVGAAVVRNPVWIVRLSAEAEWENGKTPYALEPAYLHIRLP